MRYWLQVRPGPFRTSPLCVLSIMLRKEYLTPTSEVLEVKFEGVICESGMGDRTDYTEDSSNPFN